MRGHLAWDISPRLIWQSLAFGLPDVPVRMSAWVLRLADRLILQAYVPLAGVGIYSLGYTLGSTPFELVGSAVNAAILPVFYQMDRDAPERSSQRMFGSVAAWETALLAFLGLGTILFARELILVLSTRHYLDALPIVPLVVWASVFLHMSNIPMRAIYTAKRTGYLPLIFGVPAALNIALNVLLIPRYGIIGAAWATLIAYPILFVLHLAVAQRVYRIPYPYRRMALPLVLMLLLSAGRDVVPAVPLALSLAVKLLLLAALPLGLWLLGFVTAEERAALVQAVSRRRSATGSRPDGGPPAVPNTGRPSRDGVNNTQEGASATTGETLTPRIRTVSPSAGE